MFFANYDFCFDTFKFNTFLRQILIMLLNQISVLCNAVISRYIGITKSQEVLKQKVFLKDVKGRQFVRGLNIEFIEARVYNMI